MSERRFIKVILPLRLEWQPVYESAEAEIGDRVRVIFAGREYTAVVSEVNVVPETKVSKIRRVLGEDHEASTQKFAPSTKEEIEFWRVVSDYYLCSIGEVYKAAYPSMKSAGEEMDARKRERLETSLLKYREKLEKARKDTTKSSYEAKVAELEKELRVEDNGPLSAKEPVLSASQQAAFEKILSIWSTQPSRPVLLNGRTGSGKTEMYLKLASETISRGKSVLYLVPEIALSRQLEERVKEYFPSVKVFHSGISATKKRDIPTEIRKSDTYIVLGTRSSLFLPHHNLGLIIVDEEHDSSYKQDSPAPRYNGRDTAVMLAKIQNANTILGSATPSLESLFSVSAGRFTEVKLEERFFCGEEADVMIIDTIAERRKRGMKGDFSLKLIDEIRKTLSKGEQVAILRARRSYAPAVQCEECGIIPKCPRCNVPLSLHKSASERLVCHYCGYSSPYDGVCSSCGGKLIPLGIGTQKIEEEVSELFPDSTVARLDGDTLEKEGKDIIEGFAKGTIDILVGTQIMTKGFDFESLSLVAVIEADSLLAIQDFRADERAIQLLEQFRGRSGRRGEKGLIVIQTREPEHPVFKELTGEAKPDMLSERRLFSYPPFTRELRLILKDTSERRLDYMSKELVSSLESIGLGIPIIGPYSPRMEKISDVHIRNIRMMLPRDRQLSKRKKDIEKAVLSFEKDRLYQSHIAIDVDPL